jgi:hypothetical protein
MMCVDAKDKRSVTLRELSPFVGRYVAALMPVS